MYCTCASLKQRDKSKEIKFINIQNTGRQNNSVLSSRQFLSFD